MSVTQSASVFACYDKACAPPPAGKGGSLPRSRGGTVPKDVSANHERETLSRVRFDENGNPSYKRTQVRTKKQANAAIVRNLLKDEGFLKYSRQVMEGKADELLQLAVKRFLPRTSDRKFLSQLKGRDIDAVLSKRPAQQIISALQEVLGMQKVPVEKLLAQILTKSMIDSWALSVTSGKNQVAYQLAAAEVHGSDSESFVSYLQNDPYSNPSWISGGRKVLKESRDLLHALVRAEYAATQEWLKERGIDEITLYRGSSDRVGMKRGETVRMTMNPLSSWTVRSDEAEKFARESWPEGSSKTRFVVASRIPARMIQSVPFTGRGCLDEYEFVLIGAPTEALVTEIV